MANSDGGIDSADAEILRLLQGDSRITAQQMAEKVGLSASQCARRRQRLEEEGLVRRYRADVDWRRCGLTISAFIQVVMTAHSRENARDFVRLIESTEAIVGAWTLSGEFDYLLRVVAADLEDLNRIVQDVLLPHPAVARVQSRIVMARLKADAPAPIRASR